MEEEEEERKELISLLVLTAHRMEKEKEKRMSGESKAVTDKEMKYRTWS